MLKGRESLTRLVGKRRRFLPNRQSLLSAPTQSSLNLDIDQNGKLVSVEQGTWNQQGEQNSVVEGSVTCPVCGVKLYAQNHLINSHLDECLSRGSKRKLTQRTLLELNFSPVPKIRTCSNDSVEEFGNDLFPAPHDESPVQDASWGLSNFVAVEESQNQVDSPSRNPINEDKISEVPDFDVIVTQEDIYGVTLETFIVGRRFGDETELYLGATLHLSRDPDNVKDPNAIKVVYSDSECRKVLGFLPRKLAEFLSPLIDQYCLQFVVIFFAG